MYYKHTDVVLGNYTLVVLVLEWYTFKVGYLCFYFTTSCSNKELLNR